METFARVDQRENMVSRICLAESIDKEKISSSGISQVSKDSRDSRRIEIHS